MKWPFKKYAGKIRPPRPWPSPPPTEEELVVRITQELGVEVKSYNDGCWRCGGCRRMQPGEAAQCAVEDSVMPGDPSWSVKERQLRSRWNGSFTAWCVGCCARLLPEAEA